MPRMEDENKTRMTDNLIEGTNVRTDGRRNEPVELFAELRLLFLCCVFEFSLKRRYRFLILSSPSSIWYSYIYDRCKRFIAAGENCIRPVNSYLRNVWKFVWKGVCGKLRTANRLKCARTVPNGITRAMTIRWHQKWITFSHFIRERAYRECHRIAATMKLRFSRNNIKLLNKYNRICVALLRTNDNNIMRMNN